jgi:hypothetical protein
LFVAGELLPPSSLPRLMGQLLDFAVAINQSLVLLM